MNGKEFIDSLDSKKHLMLAYRNPEYAKALQFRFLLNGLRKGETGIILTHSKPRAMENDMQNAGIPVLEYKKSKKLVVYDTPDPVLHPGSILDGFNDVIENVLQGLTPPFRITGRIIRNISIEEGIAITQRIEELFHKSMFKNFDGSVLCMYELDKVQSNDRWLQWLSRLMDCHDATIIQSHDGVEEITLNKSLTYT